MTGYHAGSCDVAVIGAGHAGIEAALAGGMRALGVGSAAANPTATYTAIDLEKADFEVILNA